MNAPKRVTPRKPVLIVDDEPLFAEGLRRALARHSEPRVVMTLREATKEINRADWAAFFVDVTLPDGSGIDLLGSIRKTHPREPIVLMTGSDLARTSRAALIHGAMFVAKPLPTEWLETFRTWVSQDVNPAADELWTRLSLLGLSERECEIFSRLASGATAEVAGSELGISAATVRSHCHRVYVRTGASSLTELLAMANGWRG